MMIILHRLKNKYYEIKNIHLKMDVISFLISLDKRDKSLLHQTDRLIVSIVPVTNYFA